MPRESRIRRLSLSIDGFLRPYIVTLNKQEAGKVVSLSKEKEKDLLVALSRVLRTIQLLTRELNSNSGSDSNSNSNSDSDSDYAAKLNLKESNCLIKVLADLILLLRVESQYVRHLACNALFVISEFLASSVIEWGCFISSLRVLLQLAICCLLSCPWSASTNVDKCLNVDSSVVVYLRDRMQHAKWSTAAGIVQVLRKILKHMKQVRDEEMNQVYLASVGSILLDVPWELVDETYFGRGSWSSDCGDREIGLMDDFSCGNLGELDPKVLFLGNFVQFVCSLVDQSNDVKPDIGYEDQNPINCKIIGLVPKLFHWCLGKPGVCGENSTSQYFRHKLLMLMLRLTYQTRLDCITLLSWLQLLHDYFEELLRKPITELETGQNQCLEGSPFLQSNLEAAECGGSSLHLQRHVVLLFLRCCFSIIKLTAETSEQCAGTAANLYLNHASFSDMNCCSRKKGLLELCKWIQGHIPTDAVVHSDLYWEKCAGFVRSFLRLYIHEDGALFKVLLQLFSIQSYLEQGSHAKKRMLQDVKEEYVSDFSKIFNPITLFHLFLAELHYDHQVLLDYLISKDAGVSCAEYLLRCLHYVCDSWRLFMHFSLDGEVRHQSSYKKRKIPLDVLNASTEPSFVSPQGRPSEEQEGERDLGNGCKQHGTKRFPFNDAKNCLLSLKHSMENLHLKNLFPYNPKVLLKRLSRFQELCINKDNDLLL